MSVRSLENLSHAASVKQCVGFLTCPNRITAL